MLFQCSSFLLSIVLSLNVAVSLSLLTSGGDAFLRFSPPTNLKLSPRCPRSHRCATTNTREHSLRRLAFTHLSYKSKPYHDGAETVTTAAAAATPTTETTSPSQNHQNIPVVPTLESAEPELSPSTEPPQKPKKKRSRIVKTSVNDSRVKVVTTLKQFYECFEEESIAAPSKKQEERVVIVRFFSHWCKSCQAIAPKYNRLARLYPKNLFIDIPVTKDNVDLQKALGIKAVPFGHIYYPKLGGGLSRPNEKNGEGDSNSATRGYDSFHLMEELKMGKMYWSDFEDIFHNYMRGNCSVAGMDYRDPIVSSGSTIREYMVL